MHYDMEDMLEQANEIQESLARSYAVPDEIDEADLEAGKLFSFLISYELTHGILSELDALALEGPEEEGASYLADLNKVPDFVDEPPVEVNEVGYIFDSWGIWLIDTFASHHDKKRSKPVYNVSFCNKLYNRMSDDRDFSMIRIKAGSPYVV